MVGSGEFREGTVSCTSGKLQRILASAHFSQHAKLNMASFVLYLLGCFAVKFKMVEVCSKAPRIELFTLEERSDGSNR